MIYDLEQTNRKLVLYAIKLRKILLRKKRNFDVLPVCLVREATTVYSNSFLNLCNSLAVLKWP